MATKTSGINIYLGRDEDKARRLAALQQLAENLDIKRYHKSGNLYSPLLCVLADLDIDTLTKAVRMVQKGRL